MKILHYSLGFPPYRTGGLTKFCMDLMHQQIKDGNDVSLLWPGEISLISHKVSIKHGKDIDGIHSWEVVNPTPISYDEGIQEFARFMAVGDINVYESFLKKWTPDVIHVHTLMGMHKSFLEAAKKLQIKLVFSAHDFFPICPKVTMFRDRRICDCISNCSKCAQCNATALPIWKTNLLQTKLYRELKNSALVKKLRKSHRDAYLSGESANALLENGMGTAEDYIELRNYYTSMLDCMDIIHYNSSVTKKAYEKYIGIYPSEVIPITHRDITDKRIEKNFSSEKMRISYLGQMGDGKGFFLLKAALDELWEERQDFWLNVFFQMDELPTYIKTHDRYSYDQLEDIFENTDVLVAPSVWYETFGYTALEALSYGVPVIVTKNVGVKDIIPAEAGIIVDDISVAGLKAAINSLTRDKLVRMNQCIIKNVHIMTLEDMSNQIVQKCYIRK